jgi:YesN/AraC family two-component response regulator
MGEPFKIYLTKIKIEMSAKLLLQSRSSIESIASQVGYNSLRQFYTMFKKYKGVTPAMYRERHLGE